MFYDLGYSFFIYLLDYITPREISSRKKSKRVEILFSKENRPLASWCMADVWSVWGGGYPSWSIQWGYPSWSIQGGTPAGGSTSRGVHFHVHFGGGPLPCSLLILSNYGNSFEHGIHLKTEKPYYVFMANELRSISVISAVSPELTARSGEDIWCHWIPSTWGNSGYGLSFYVRYHRYC